ncbi:MAG: RNA-binding S4 domain-containing protein [Myxococcota bacterium]|nr:RNA-binding S4 domain-containing protein [Myxococcota bacterium]
MGYLEIVCLGYNILRREMTKRKKAEPQPAEPKTSVRVDKWLWATRSFKTRSLATDACSSGHVKVNKSVVKASYKVKLEDEVSALTPGGKRILIVKGLAEKRGPYSFAQTLYEDLTPPPVPQIAPPRFEKGMGRPTKKNRRAFNKIRGR